MSLAQHYHITIISLSLSQPYHININHHQYDNHMSVISVLYRQDHIMTMYVIVMLSGYVTSSSLGIFPYSTIPCCICKITPCKSLSKHAIKPKSTTVREEQEAYSWFDISRSNIFIFCIDSLCCSSAKHHQDTVIRTLVI